MSKYPQHAKSLADELIDVGQWCNLRDWVPATSSNFSQRIDEKTVLVTASGHHKGYLTDEHFLAVDLQGQPVDQGKPSAETLLHCQRYQQQVNTQCVLHTHSKAATVLSRIHGYSLTLSNYELLKAFPTLDTHQTELVLPIFENDQNIERLANEITRWESHQYNASAFCAYMIKGHGIYTWADSLAQCKIQLEALEFLFECELDQLLINRSS